MKLIRYGPQESERPGVELPNGKRIDISDFISDINGESLHRLPDLDEWIRINGKNAKEINPKERLGPPITGVSKLICIGLNYAQHASESGMALPKEPLVVFKSTTAITGPNDDVIIPKDATKVDWEVELAFVIGKKAQYVSLENAMEYIAGYLVHNDVSEREFQFDRGGQWVKGKSCDTFAPLGPYLVTKDEIKNPHNLNLWLKVNGELVQNSNTSDMVFSIPALVENLSKYMTLLPGDVITTGTPYGVGFGFKPPRYLKSGDVMELGVDGLGVQHQKLISYQNR